MTEFVKTIRFDELQGFALLNKLPAVYSACIIIANFVANSKGNLCKQIENIGRVTIRPPGAYTGIQASDRLSCYCILSERR